jgi:TonB family protein
MTYITKAISALTLLLAFGASTQMAPAQTVPESVDACPARNVDARPLTNYPVDWPSTVPAELHQFLRGPAIVQFDVAADGSPQNATTIKSTGFYQLDRVAEELVLSQRYAPAVRGCLPVPATYLYEVDY